MEVFCHHEQRNGYEYYQVPRRPSSFIPSKLANNLHISLLPNHSDMKLDISQSWISIQYLFPTIYVTPQRDPKQTVKNDILLHEDTLNVEASETGRAGNLPRMEIH